MIYIIHIIRSMVYMLMLDKLRIPPSENTRLDRLKTSNHFSMPTKMENKAPYVLIASYCDPLQNVILISSVYYYIMSILHLGLTQNNRYT